MKNPTLKPVGQANKLLFPADLVPYVEEIERLEGVLAVTQDAVVTWADRVAEIEKIARVALDDYRNGAIAARLERALRDILSNANRGRNGA